MEASKEIDIELFPFLRVYKDGRVEKIHVPKIVPPSPHPDSGGVASKDVVISPETGVCVRLFRPHPPPPPGKKLPILFYIHGGGFCIESARSDIYTSFLNAITAQAGVIGVSVDYRLAPEHPVPTPHLDSWAALQWVARQASGGPHCEPWLADHGDFDQIFLGGDSAGGNIAHHLAMAASGCPVIGPLPADNLPMSITGLILFHPYFAGWTPVDDEFVTKQREESAALWRVTCPGAAAGTDDPLVHLLADSAPELSQLRCRRVLIFAAGVDYLGDRARLYNELLGRGGWEGVVEFEQHDDEDHVFHLMKPTCDNAKSLMNRVVAFINRD
ncbi:probable carboxylesterase 2 [Nymphaea colorata]|nr:probable carboxylesterase 2 [Nymphaea colorata]